MISLRILFVVLAFFRGQFQQKKTGVGWRRIASRPLAVVGNSFGADIRSARLERGVDILSAKGKGKKTRLAYRITTRCG
jgi:hypothetical protein